VGTTHLGLFVHSSPSPGVLENREGYGSLSRGGANHKHHKVASPQNATGATSRANVSCSKSRRKARNVWSVMAASISPQGGVLGRAEGRRRQQL